VFLLIVPHCFSIRYHTVHFPGVLRTWKVLPLDFKLIATQKIVVSLGNDLFDRILDLSILDCAAHSQGLVPQSSVLGLLRTKDLVGLAHKYRGDCINTEVTLQLYRGYCSHIGAIQEELQLHKRDCSYIGGTAVI